VEVNPVTYKDFSYGWVPDSVEKDPDNIPDNGLEQADNVDINGQGGISKRRGSGPLNATSYGANVKQVEEWIKSDSTVQLFGVVGTDFCKFDEDGTKTVVQALDAEAGKIWWFPTLTGGVDNLYFGDTYKYFVWDGTTCAEVTPAANSDLTNIKAAKKVIWHTHSHRYFAITKGMNGVSYSESDDPTDFRPSSILYPTQADGEPVGIEEFGDAILVRYTFGAYYWRGYDPTDAVWFPVPLKVGGFNPWDSAIIPGALFYPGAGGIYTPGFSLLGANITAEASGDLVPNLAQGRVSTLINDIYNKDIICTIDDGSKTYMAYNDTPGATTNDKVLVWHRLNGGGFTRYLGWNVNHWCLRKNGDLLFATENYIMKAKQPEYNDNGQPIHFIAKTKWFSLGYLGLLKKLFKTTIISQQNQTKSTVDMTVNSDTVVTGVTKTGISLNSGFIWGVVYGPVWGGMKIITKILKTVIKGLRFQIILENNVLNEAVDLYGLSFKFRVGKPGGEKVD
jgi:hypothetical protein